MFLTWIFLSFSLCLSFSLPPFFFSLSLHPLSLLLPFSLPLLLSKKDKHPQVRIKKYKNSHLTKRAFGGGDGGAGI